MKILHIVIIVAIAAAAFLFYKKMKSNAVQLREPGSPPTSDTTILASPGEDFLADTLDDEDNNGTEVGDVSDMTDVAAASAKLMHGYMAWFPGNR